MIDGADRPGSDGLQTSRSAEVKCSTGTRLMPVCIEGLQVRYTSFAQHRERSSIGIWFVLLLSLLLEYIPGGSGRTYHA